ncbi:MAG: hypothetical protein D6760_08790 [Deltaproteobacteria bacterium]|nr:MAG: hypothetical protein D6760_08790 [Deltaproteobacteria bacterium]
MARYRLRPNIYTDRMISWLAVAGAVAVAVWLTAPAWEPGLLLGRDGPRHALRARAMAEMLMTQHRFDGWSPYWLLGAPLFLFQSYGYYLVQALLAMAVAATAPATLPQAQAWIDKVAAILPLLLLPPACYRLSRRLGLGRLGATTAAYASLGFGTETGYGVVAALAVGLELHAVGVLLVALALPLLLDLTALDRRRFCLVIVLVAVTLVVHFISGIHLLLATAFLSLWAAVAGRSGRPLGRAALLSTGAVFLAGHALFPALELHSSMGPSVVWNHGKLVREILTGVHFGPRPLLLVALIGWLSIVFGRPATAALRRVAFLGLFVLLATILLPDAHQVPSPFGTFSGALQPRGLPFVCLLLPVFTGYAAERAAFLARSPDWKTRIAVVLATVCVLPAWYSALAGSRRWVRTEAHLPVEQSRACYDVLAWLSRHGRPGEIVAYEPRAFTLRECGTTSLASLINLKTGLYTLGGDQAELARVARTVFTPSRIARASPEQVRAWIRRYRVAYVLVRSAGVRSKLLASGAVRTVFDAGPVTVYAADRKHHALQGPGLVVARERIEDAAATWTVENRSNATRRAIISISYHPAWRAYVDGEPLVTQRTTDALMAVAVPPGRHRITLRFARRPAERLYHFVSLATLLLLVGSTALRRAHRSASSS